MTYLNYLRKKNKGNINLNVPIILSLMGVNFLFVDYFFSMIHHYIMNITEETQ